MAERYVYKYAVIIGFDGMGNFNEFAKTPNIDTLFESGAKTYYALSMNPTISAQNWGAMLLGASPEVHGLTNSIVGSTHYENKQLPSVFSRLRERFPESYLASCSNWNPINFGIIEEGLNVDKHTAGTDKELTPKILSCIRRKPQLLFIQFDDIDGAGHTFDYGSKEHLETIEQTDGYVGEIYDAYKKAGIADETLFIGIADHGGIRRGHGGYTKEEKYIYFAVNGKSIEKSEIQYAKTRDVAAIVLYALGLDVPEFNLNGFSSRIPLGIFPEYEGNYEIPVAKEKVIEQRPTPDIESENGLYSFFDKGRISLAMFFDDEIKDETANNNISVKGTPKFYSLGVKGARGELGSTGWCVADNVSFGENSFAFALWIKTQFSLPEAPAICSNRDWWWQNRDSTGVTLALRCNDITFSLGCRDDHNDISTPFPETHSEGWLHFIASVDKEKREVRIYYDFELCNTVKLDEKYLINLDNLPFVIGNDAPESYNNERHNFIFNLDDFLIFNTALDNNDVKKLEEYYK